MGKPEENIESAKSLEMTELQRMNDVVVANEGAVCINSYEASDEFEGREGVLLEICTDDYRTYVRAVNALNKPFTFRRGCGAIRVQEENAHYPMVLGFPYVVKLEPLS